MLAARISLTLSRHSSLSFIALGRSSGQQPVSSHSCWMYVRAGRPAFARPCVGIHKSTSLMSSSLLLQQCPACLVRLTWIVFVIGGKCCIPGWGKKDHNTSYKNITHTIYSQKGLNLCGDWRIQCCILTFWPGQKCHSRWCTGWKWHILMAVMRGNRVGGNWLMKWDEVKKNPIILS